MGDAAVLTALVAAGAVGYTYVGYPIVIAALARLLPARHAPDPSWRPTVTVLLAVHNGAAHVVRKLERVLAQDYPQDRIQVLVASDGSTDGTDELVRAQAGRFAALELVRLERRSGKPVALMELLGRATGEVLVPMDVRQEINPGAFAALVRDLADPTIGVVGAEYRTEGAGGAGAYYRYERWIRANEGRFRGLVGVSGSLYAIRRADFPRLPPDCLLDDMWVPLSVRLAGKRVIPCADALSIDATLADRDEFPRKVRTLAGNYQLFARLPRLLVPFANPSWLETFSHKIMRLVCPVALLVLAAATVVALAPGAKLAPWQRVVVGALAAGQVGFYAAALAGARLGKLGSLARTFVVLNCAALLGGWRWARGGQEITW